MKMNLLDERLNFQIAKISSQNNRSIDIPKLYQMAVYSIKVNNKMQADNWHSGVLQCVGHLDFGFKFKQCT